MILLFLEGDPTSFDFSLLYNEQEQYNHFLEVF